MMIKSILLSVFLTCTLTAVLAQKNVYLNISHVLGSSDFTYNQTAQNDLTQNFKISRVEYYISSIFIIHDGGTQTSVPNKYILAKGSSTVSELLGNFNVTNVEGVKFSIGVEAPINNADPSLQISGTPLAFQSPSMHWGWTAGYRFLALEGTAGTNFATSFEMHGLGNSNYFNQTKMVAGIESGNDISINLNADYTQALRGISVNAGPLDHGVNGTDLTALQNFRDYVFTADSGVAGSNERPEDELNVKIYPIPATDKLFINFENKENAPNKLLILDITGKIVMTSILDETTEINVSNLGRGLYTLQFYNKNTQVANRQFVIE
jgi:hypothetical protein